MRYVSLLLLLFCCCPSQNEGVLPQRQRTLALIKPDAVSSHHIGEIITAYERDGFSVVAMKVVKMSRQQASTFYEEHRERSFYGDLVGYMSSNPIIALVLEGDAAVDRHRKLIGATDPAAAAEGTLRRRIWLL